MGTLIDRIYQIIENKSISVLEFSKKIDVSNGYLAKQKANKANVGSHIIEKIVRCYPDINPLWLITGEGDMFIHSQNSVNVSDTDNNSDNEDYEVFFDNLTQVQRITDIVDKERVSDAYSFLANKLMIIYEYLEHYSLLNKSQEFPKKYTQKGADKKEITKEVQKIIATERELLKIIAPHKDMIFDLYDKISDFDDKHDRFYSIDEDMEKRIDEIMNDASK